jgi:hypothetical protein
MDAVLLCLGIALGALAYHLIRRPVPPAEPSAPPVRIAAIGDTAALQKLNELRLRIDKLQELQRTTSSRAGRSFETLEWQLRRIAAQLRVAPAGPAHDVAPVEARLEVPPEAPIDDAPDDAMTRGSSEPFAALSIGSLVMQWNELAWNASSDPPRSFARELPGDWRLSDELGHKYFLLYRTQPELTGEPMYLLPFLDKNIALFTEFFDGPMSGVARRVVAAAEVRFCEHNTTIDQELSKLGHVSYSVGEVLVASKRGQLA